MTRVEGEIRQPQAPGGSALTPSRTLSAGTRYVIPGHAKLLMSISSPLPVIDARKATRARQPGRTGLREVIVIVTQSVTGRQQAVRVVAADAKGARALAMLHTTVLDVVPRELSPASLALRHLEFEVRPDGSPFEPPGPVPSARVAQPAIPAAPDEAAAGPDDYTTYSLVIATDPLYWTADGTELSALQARHSAEALADAVRNVFPGLRCDLVPGPVEKLDLSGGPDADVRERLEAWVERRMGEMLATK